MNYYDNNQHVMSTICNPCPYDGDCSECLKDTRRNKMSGFDNVIKALEICSNTEKSCCPDTCPYYKSNTSCCEVDLKKDALNILKQVKKSIKEIQGIGFD